MRALGHIAAISAALVLLSGADATPPAGVDPGTDRVLWCSSAFYWLATNAYDAGANDEAQEYEGWSNALEDRGRNLLAETGKDGTAIQIIEDTYDDEVMTELGTPKARYDVTTCPDLVGQ